MRRFRHRDLLGRTTQCRCDPFNRRFGQMDVGSTSSQFGARAAVITNLDPASLSAIDTNQLRVRTSRLHKISWKIRAQHLRVITPLRVCQVAAHQVLLRSAGQEEPRAFITPPSTAHAPEYGTRARYRSAHYPRS